MSNYRRRRFEPIAFWGLIVTLLLHVGSVVGIVLYRRALQAAEKPKPPPSYVVARLIRKGVKKDKKKLPDKIVPQQATQKQKAVSYDAAPDDKPNKPKKKDRRPQADRQQSALDRMAALARAQKAIEAEGDPNGVVGGHATAGAGDRYMTRIADIWNRTWALPAIIDRDVARKLYVLVTVKIDKTGKVLSVSIDRSSRNDQFDSSIKYAWARIPQLPVPPPDRLASILANGLALKLTWRGLR